MRTQLGFDLLHAFDTFATVWVHVCAAALTIAPRQVRFLIFESPTQILRCSESSMAETVESPLLTVFVCM